MWMVKSSRKLAFILVSYSLHKHSQTIAYRLQKNSFQTTSMYVFQKFSFVVAFFIRYKTSSRLLRKAFYRYKMKFESLTIIWACIVAKAREFHCLDLVFHEGENYQDHREPPNGFFECSSVSMSQDQSDKFGQLVVSGGSQTSSQDNIWGG